MITKENDPLSRFFASHTKNKLPNKSKKDVENAYLVKKRSNSEKPGLLRRLFNKLIGNS